MNESGGKAAPDVERAGFALDVRSLRAGYGDVVAVNDISFSVEEGEFVTLLGPSGCGKTTTLRCIAGLETPMSGTISIGGETVAGPGVALPPSERDINMVFQTYAVWPHLTVWDNVSYGLRKRGSKKAEVRSRTSDVLDLVGLGDFAHRYGTELSGGQQQRVAVARAVVTEPRLLLFDEPLSNLDAGLRERMRDELMELQQRIGRTAIYVTHDQTEAMAMSHRIILMRDGSVEQESTPRELYREPKTEFAATFVGSTNLLSGSMRSWDGDHHFLDAASDLKIAIHEGPDVAADTATPENVSLAIRPEYLVVGDHAQACDNHWLGRIERVTYLGDKYALDLVVDGAHMKAEASAEVSWEAEGLVQVGVMSRNVRLIPSEGGTTRE